MAILGNNLLLVLNGQVIAGTKVKSDEMAVDGEMIPKSSPDDGEWTHVTPGRKSWSVNISWLVFANSDVRRLLAVGTRLQIVYKARGAADSAGVTGYAYIKNAKITATRGNIATGSFTLQGDGPLQ